jgi:hypothetical protein
LHGQHHGLDRLAWPGRQQPLELGVCRFPLCAPLKQGAADRVLGAQVLNQRLNILNRHVHLRCGVDQCAHAALLPCMDDGQNYTTFRSLVVVLVPFHRSHCVSRVCEVS